MQTGLPLVPPTRGGTFTLRAQLVQMQAGKEAPLGVPPGELTTEVHPVSLMPAAAPAS